MQNRKKFTASFRSIFNKDANPWKKELFARWFTQLDLSKGQLFSSKTEEEETAKKMEQNLYHHFFPETGNTKVVRWPIWITTTAATVAVIISILWFTNGYKKDQKLVFKETFTLPGERKLITLSDGSEIALNNSSRIKFPIIFADSIREVFLEGEAFFNISHNKKKPFIVHTKSLGIQVLGTSFNVRNYPSDLMVSVVVATGKVGVQTRPGVHQKSNPTSRWVLNPGELLTYNPITQHAAQQKVNPADYTAWQKGELVFKNETLATICKRLERWYGVSIAIQTNSLKSKKFSLKQKNESLATVLKMLAMSGEFKYEIKDKRINIR